MIHDKNILNEKIHRLQHAFQPYHYLQRRFKRNRNTELVKPFENAEKLPYYAPLFVDIPEREQFEEKFSFFWMIGSLVLFSDFTSFLLLG